MKKRISRRLWANYNGSCKPITPQQLAEVLARWGIEEHFDENGKGYYLRKDFEPVWQHLGIGTTRREPQ